MNLLDRILPAAKAWLALVGAIATALLAHYGPDTAVGGVLTVVVAVASAVVVYRVPNAEQ